MNRMSGLRARRIASGATLGGRRFEAEAPANGSTCARAPNTLRAMWPIRTGGCRGSTMEAAKMAGPPK